MGCKMRDCKVHIYERQNNYNETNTLVCTKEIEFDKGFPSVIVNISDYKWMYVQFVVQFQENTMLSLRVFHQLEAYLSKERLSGVTLFDRTTMRPMMKQFKLVFGQAYYNNSFGCDMFCNEYDTAMAKRIIKQCIFNDADSKWAELQYVKTKGV